MINNRQGGRRRGRGGQRPPNVGGGQPGNRQDNRQRGNAAQLLEKYKNMARDAQLAGDRVQSEYYLQFADHYHRVLGESRSKYEEQRRQRGDDMSDEQDDDDSMMDGGDEQQQPEREVREARDDRDPRENRERRPRRDNRGSGARPGSDNDDDERIALDVLPPSIGVSDGGLDDGAEVIEAKPRRRPRRPTPDDESDIAPAA